MKQDAYLAWAIDSFRESLQTADIFFALKRSIDNTGYIEDSTDEPVPSDPSHGDYDMESLA